MAKKRSKRERPEVPTIVRRAPQDRKRLSPELEEFARSDEKRLPPPKRRPRLRDPRPTALIPGVANRDARLVCDAKLERLEELLDTRGEEFDELLAVIYITRLWRARSLTAFDTMAAQVLELPAEEAREAARRGAEKMGTQLELLSDEATAVWVRAMAALQDTQLSARIRPIDEGRALSFELTVDDAPEVLLEVGRRMNSLVEDRRARGGEAGPKADRASKADRRASHPKRRG